MSAVPFTAWARGIAVAATAATLALAPGFTSAAHAATTDPAQVAAGWLSSQLADGDHMETVYGDTAYPDAGLTADVIFALDAAGVAQTAAAAATTWLEGQVASYTGDGSTESYAGALAKLALVAQVQGKDPHAFGGTAPVNDLLARLLAQLDPSGRFSDVSAWGDYSNSIGQSLAILALGRDTTAPAAAVDFLVGAQCPDGGFPLTFGASTCASDVDATAYVVQALLAESRTTDADEALTWLAAQQRSNGGFGGNGPTTATNANSSGLAVAALRLGGRTTAADAGEAFLLSLQVDCTGAEAERGAIAYDATGFTAGTAPRATSQAIVGLVGSGLSTLTSTGAIDTFPTLDCTVPDTEVEVTTTGAPTGGSGADAGAGDGGGAGNPVATPELPATGDPVRDAAVVGGLLLLTGAALVVIGRRTEHAAA